MPITFSFCPDSYDDDDNIKGMKEAIDVLSFWKKQKEYEKKVEEEERIKQIAEKPKRTRKNAAKRAKPKIAEVLKFIEEKEKVVGILPALV